MEDNNNTFSASPDLNIEGQNVIGNKKENFHSRSELTTCNWVGMHLCIIFVYYVAPPRSLQAHKKSFSRNLDSETGEFKLCNYIKLVPLYSIRISPI